MVNGRIIAWMVLEFINGKMEGSMKAITNKIINMDGEYINGQMAPSLMEAGKRANNTVKATILIPMEISRLAFGSMVSFSNGYQQIIYNKITLLLMIKYNHDQNI